MEITLRSFIIGIVISAGVSAVLTKYYFPRIESKTETVEKEVIRTDVVTVTKEVTKVDGTKETTTTVVDKSTKKTDTKETQVKLDVRPDWLVGGGILSNFKDKPEYELSVGKRILGPFLGQVKYQTNGYIGVNVLVEF